jgi:hypothetical protein
MVRLLIHSLTILSKSLIYKLDIMRPQGLEPRTFWSVVCKFLGPAVIQKFTTSLTCFEAVRGPDALSVYQFIV